MNNLYNIKNEINAVKLALSFFVEFKKEFEHAALAHYRTTWSYKIDYYIFNQSLEKIDFDEELFYAFRFRYRGFNWFMVDDAIETLTIYNTAITRNNDFQLSEHCYKKFLKYVEMSEGVRYEY